MGGFFEKDVTPLSVHQVLTITEPTIHAHTFRARHRRSATTSETSKSSLPQNFGSFFFSLGCRKTICYVLADIKLCLRALVSA